VKERARGFTLIELMIVVAIIGILAAVAVPKFADMVRKSHEGSTKGNLGALRSVLSIYYADNEAWYPTGSYSSNSTVLTSLVPKYIKEIPKARAANYHAASDRVFNHTYTIQTHWHDQVGWMYDGYTTRDKLWGELWVSCNHTDSKGTVWSEY